MRKGPRAVRAKSTAIVPLLLHLCPSVSSASVLPRVHQRSNLRRNSVSPISPPLYQALSPSFFTISSPLYQALSISPQAKVISSLPFIICLVVPENEFQKHCNLIHMRSDLAILSLSLF